MQSSKKQDTLAALEKAIHVTFKNKGFLKTAFVHTSYVNEHKNETADDNERLEFLGDAVLELITTESLFKDFPKFSEGKLTALRSALVKGKHLAEVARHLKLGEHLYLSRGEEQSGGRDKNYILANTLEALIGAIYLDKGFAAAGKFIARFILKNLDEIIAKDLHVDTKSKFQEYAQERIGVTPNYRVLSEKGPDHNKVFEVGAYIGEELIGSGTGSSKQKGEQAAALAALKAKSWL